MIPHKQRNRIGKQFGTAKIFGFSIRRLGLIKER